ncbi:uncharacterized protein [Haliotis asinina]|uniref:uncharacterized protein n=1 Tax=Haliotis asinina TaxID=109174 RepID=UPI00353216A5
MLGIIKEHNNGNPYIEILTQVYRNAIMVWIYRQNLVLNNTIVHTKLVPPGGMALKYLLQEQDVTNMNNMTVVTAEFLSGKRKRLTSPDDMIDETCLISVKMSVN